MGIEDVIRVTGRYALVLGVLIIGVWIYLSDPNNVVNMISGGILALFGFVLIFLVVYQDLMFKSRESQINAHLKLGPYWRDKVV